MMTSSRVIFCIKNTLCHEICIILPSNHAGHFGWGAAFTI